jgi:hypothetical protein
VAYFRIAPVHEPASEGVTIAVAMLIHLTGRAVPAKIDVDRWVQEIDDKILRVFNAEAAPVGIAIRATERAGKRIADSLILDAAIACPAQLERSQAERPVRTVAEFGTPKGDIAN